MKYKILVLFSLISMLSYGKIVTENPKETIINERIYDFSKVNDKFLKVKEYRGTVHIINKEYITNIEIRHSDDSMFIHFFGHNSYTTCDIIKVHKDSYEDIYKYLMEKGVPNE